MCQQENEQNNNIYYYQCPDIESAMIKLGDIEDILELWLQNNEDYEYKTRLIFKEIGVTIELQIF